MAMAAQPALPIDRFVAALEAHGAGPRRSGRGWAARCPSHPDRDPSLSVTESPDGKVLITCHAGCGTRQVVEALGLGFRDLFPPEPARTPQISDLGQLKATYVYVSEHGEIIARKKRWARPTGGKTFRWEHPTAGGAWASGLGTEKPVVYNAHRLARAKADAQTVWVVEGEKDAENLDWVLPGGQVAVTAPDGAGKWGDAQTEALAGCRVVVVCIDDDHPGRAHGRLVARSLAGKVGRVVVVRPAEGKDVTDHLHAHRTLVELVELDDTDRPTGWVGEVADEDEPAEPPTEDTPAPGLGSWRIDWDEFWAEDHVAEDWLLEPLFARGRAHALYAPAKTGKSLLVQWLVSRAVRGLDALAHPAGRPLVVVYVDYENSRSDLRERLESFGVRPGDDLTRLHYISLPAIDGLDTGEGAKVIVDYCTIVNPDLVIFDTLSRAVRGEENSADTLRQFYRLCGLHLKSMGIAYVRLDHAGKDAEKGQRGTSAKNDDVDVVLRLTRRDDGLLVEATHRRMSWVPERTELVEDTDDDGATYWRLAMDTTMPVGTEEVMGVLDRLRVPVDKGVNECMALLRAAGEGRRKPAVSAAVKRRRQVAQRAIEGGWIGGNHPGNHPFGLTPGTVLVTVGTTPQTPCSDSGNHLGNHREPPASGNWEPGSLSREGTGTSPTPEPAPLELNPDLFG